MAIFFDFLWMGMILFRILSVQCNEDIVSMIDRMDGLNKDVIRVQERVVQQIDSAKIALRLEMKEHIREYVRDAIAEILPGQSVEKRGQIVSEVKQRKGSNHQMKRQLNRVLVSLKDVQDEMKTIQEAVKKSQNDRNVFKECSKCSIDSEMLEERVIDEIDSAKTALKLEWKQQIRQYVRVALSGILQDESAEEIMRSQVISEVRQLKQKNLQMKRQLNRVSMSLKDVQEEFNSLKSESDTRWFKGSSKCCVDSETIKRDLETCKAKIERVNQLAIENDKEIHKLKQTLEMLNETTAIPSPTPVTTTQAAIPEPQEERSRIIIAPMWNHQHHQFRQLNIHNNSINTYPLRRLKRVSSMAYVSKHRKLLIGLYGPNKILSTTLDRDDVTILKNNIETFGMTVDEARDIVFLTTSEPRRTISRMTTRGKNLTTLRYLSNYGGIPYAISVDTKKKTIYACSYDKIFTLKYDGSHMQIFGTGFNMYALTLDITGRFLYYSDNRKLLKMSLSQNVSEVVTEFSATPLNLIFHDDAIYFSNWGSKTIGVVRLGNNVVSQTLQTLKDWEYQVICLVP